MQISVVRCIFCKHDSAASVSVEHILPESMGNTDHTLPATIVCDKCNNYFSRKLESKVLNSPRLLKLRQELQIPSKRGRIPEYIQNSDLSLPEFRLMGRFIGKIGLEVLAQRAKDRQLIEMEIIDKTELDPIRNFVRYNEHPGDWPFSFRPLHPPNAVFHENDGTYELLHEYDLLYTKSGELYIIVSIFGVEFAMNLGGPHNDGYRKWLESNSYSSPLYSGKNRA